MPSLLCDDTPPVLTAGPLVLDTGSRLLSGPRGSVRLDLGPYCLLKQLMAHPWQVLPYERLTAAIWPDPEMEPENAVAALRVRAARARDAMQKVGVAPTRLVTQHATGFLIEAEPRVYRALTPMQAAAVDALAATHPAFQPGAAA